MLDHNTWEREREKNKKETIQYDTNLVIVTCQSCITNMSLAHKKLISTKTLYE